MLLVQVGVGLYDEVTSQPGMQTYMAMSEIAVGVLFTIEVSVKILAEGEQVHSRRSCLREHQVMFCRKPTT